MKRTWSKVLLAGVAATALMLAAGCSDGSSEDWSGAEQGADASAQDAQVVGEQSAQDVQDAEEEQGAQDVQDVGEQGAQDVQDAEEEQGAQDVQDAEEEQGAQAELLTITEDDVLELIKEIGQVAGTNSAHVQYAYWDFPNADLIEDDVGLVACVQWFREQSRITGASPNIWHTRNFLQQRGKVSTSLLSVDLSGIDWDESTESRPQAEKGEIGKRYMTITIELAEGASAELPKELGAITVAFDSMTSKWLNNEGA